MRSSRDCLIEGESLVNDGTALVAYALLRGRLLTTEMLKAMQTIDPVATGACPTPASSAAAREPPGRGRR